MRKRLILAVAPVVAAASIGAGTAYAYFSDSGSGTSSVSTGNMQPVTVDASTGTPGSPLEPGGDGDVVLRVTNPNPYGVTLISVTGHGSITPDDGHGSCTTTGITFTDQSNLTTPVAANGTTQVDLPHATSMDASSSNGCQGATFSVPVTIVVHK